MKLKLSIDLNETIQSQHTQIVLEFMDNFGVSITLDDFDRWNAPIAERYSLPNPDEVARFMWNNAGLEMRAAPFASAVDVVNMFSGQGHHIDILTASWLDRDKIAYWLRGHGIRYDTITKASSGEKHECDFDIAIDDHPLTAGNMLAHNRKYIIKDLPYNRLQAGLRFTHWDQLPSIVNFIAQNA